MEHLPTIYGAAVLLPLASFFIILVVAQQLGKFAAWVATSAILTAGLLSFLALGTWLTHHWPAGVHHGGHEEHAAPVHEEAGGARRAAAANYFVALVQEPATQDRAGHEAPGHGAVDAAH